MVTQLLTVLVGAAYLIAVYLLWTDRSVRPLLLLVAGSIATLAQPLWTRLYGAPPNVPGDVIQIGSAFSVPFWSVLAGGVLIALPALFVMYGLRHRWWVQHYAAGWGFFIAFVLYFLIVAAFETRYEISLFTPLPLPVEGLAGPVVHAVLLAGTSFGLLYAFVATRHYSLIIALLQVLLSGLAASLLLQGILFSPYWVARLLDQSDRILLLSAAISVALVLWAVHLLAIGLHEGRAQRLQWR